MEIGQNKDMEEGYQKEYNRIVQAFEKVKQDHDSEIWEQINQLTQKIEKEQFYIDQSSNPMKLQRRRKTIKEYKQLINFLKQELLCK